MILEALHYAATWPVTPQEFRPHVKSSVSLWSRANRCATAWAEHEENSRDFIRAAMSGLKRRRTAVVLGSGLLRDVPIRDLAKGFDTVVLVDLVHLAGVRAGLLARRISNVRLISRDLSGLGDARAGKPVEPLSFLRQVPYLDFVVSANLLSQIVVGARRSLSGMPEATQEEVLQALVRAHLDGLSGLPCESVLISDISYAVRDRAGQVSEAADLLCGVTAPEASKRWSWPVAPFGELGRDVEAVHEVIAR